MRHVLRRWRLAAGVFVVALLATGGAAAAAPTPPPRPSVQLTADQEIAARALSRDFRVPLAEARARMQRQSDFGELSEQLPQELGGAYAGMFIDNAHGGRAVVLVAVSGLTRHREVVRALAAARGLPADMVEVRQARHSLMQLSKVNRVVGDGLVRLNRGSTSPLSAWLDIAGNRVVIGVAEGATVTAAQESFIAANRARYGDAVDQGTYAGPVSATASACSWPRCDPPLRAGLWISAGGYDAAAYCTSGFPAYSRSDGKWFLVTAGHCDKQNLGVTWAEKFASDGWHAIGPVHHAVWDSRGDAAIIRINNPALLPYGWSPENWVYVRESEGSYDTAENPEYDITSVGGYGDIPWRGDLLPVGYYVCHTGATWGTSCGQVVEVGVTVTYGGVTVKNLGKVVGMTTCQGDSGGPIYVQHTGFGIYVATTFSGATKVGANGSPQKCGYISYYQGLIGLQNLLNVNIALL